MSMDYRSDVKMLREGPVTDDNLRFVTATESSESLDLAVAMTS
jgi:hypothetical protein